MLLVLGAACTKEVEVPGETVVEGPGDAHATESVIVSFHRVPIAHDKYPGSSATKSRGAPTGRDDDPAQSSQIRHNESSSMSDISYGFCPSTDVPFP